MAVLTREAVLGALDLKRETVSVPEWGGDVIVQEMTAARRLEFERLITEDEKQLRELLVAFCAVDEAGELLFTPLDVQKLSGKSFRAIKRVSDVALRLNRVGAAQEAELRENFTESQG